MIFILRFLCACLFRLDQILGRQGSKAKDVYDSKQSLASRIVKTERQVNIFDHFPVYLFHSSSFLFYFSPKVDEIEEKLDRLISIYEEDRKKLAQIQPPTPRCPPCTPLPTSPSPPYAYVNHPAPWVSILFAMANLEVKI